MAGRPKEVWNGTVARVQVLMTMEGVRVHLRLFLDKFPGRDVAVNLTPAEARKWADALNHYADKAEALETGNG